MFWLKKREDRLLAALRAELAQGLDSQRRDFVQKLEALRAELANSSEKLERLQPESRAAKKPWDALFRQIESLLAIYRVVPLKGALPFTRRWAASPDLLLHLYTSVCSARPAVVVELGSGVSTLLIATAFRELGSGRVWSLEHDPGYYGKTHALLQNEGLEKFVDLLLAPLSPWTPQRPSSLGSEWTWYDVPGPVKELNSVDLLLVDGPPRQTGNYARYPALPEFINRLNQESVVLLDDADREQEKAIANAWVKECGVVMRRLPKFDKGLAEFSLAPTR